MKRIFATAITVVMTGTSIWLATAPADAKPKPKPPENYSGTIKIVPRWTYQGDGKLAITTRCSQRQDIHVVSSGMLPHAVALRSGGNLLILVTDKTKPGKYSITLWCAPNKGQVDAMAMARVKIVKRMPPFKQPPTPALPRHFKANVTVSSGPPVVKKASHGKKKPEKGH